MQQNALWIVVHGALETLAMDIYVKDSVKRAPGRMKLCLRDLKDAVGAREFYSSMAMQNPLQCRERTSA